MRLGENEKENVPEDALENHLECICVRDRDRKSVCVFKIDRVCVFEIERVCVFERERHRDRNSVCVRDRE